MHLVPCAACRRHFDVRASACPFCATARASDAVTFVTRAGRLSRAAVFVGAAACYTSTNAPPPSTVTPTPASSTPDTGAQARWDAEPPGTPPNPAYAPAPRPDRATLLIRVVDASSRVFPGVMIDIIGPETRRVTSGAGGIALVENLLPGTYRVAIVLPPGQPPLAATTSLAAGAVQPMATLGEAPRAIATPVDNACCKPYGAPPARRRVV